MADLHVISKGTIAMCDKEEGVVMFIVKNGNEIEIGADCQLNWSLWPN